MQKKQKQIKKKQETIKNGKRLECIQTNLNKYLKPGNKGKISPTTSQKKQKSDKGPNNAILSKTQPRSKQS